MRFETGAEAGLALTTHLGLIYSCIQAGPPEAEEDGRRISRSITDGLRIKTELDKFAGEGEDERPYKHTLWAEDKFVGAEIHTTDRIPTGWHHWLKEAEDEHKKGGQDQGSSNAADWPGTTEAEDTAWHVRLVLTDHEYNVLQEVVESEEVLHALNLKEPIDRQQMARLIRLLDDAEGRVTDIQRAREHIADCRERYKAG